MTLKTQCSLGDDIEGLEAHVTTDAVSDRMNGSLEADPLRCGTKQVAPYR